MTDSWALQAIEQAALERAQRALSFPTIFIYQSDYGPVTEKQVAWLFADYHRRTGRSPSAIDPSEAC